MQRSGTSSTKYQLPTTMYPLPTTPENILHYLIHLTMRTHTCGELRLTNVGEKVTLCGWVQKVRKFGGMTFIDLRDRYGITQLVFDQSVDADLCDAASKLGREFVIRINGEVRERSDKNPNLPTGNIELDSKSFDILNKSKTPPFTIEDDTDGGDDLRMKYRYLDLRRPMVQQNVIMRHTVAQEVRKYLADNNFLEIETPFLIKSTPEGARDFVVPSRMNPGNFYALPQSPQTFKQLLMVSGYDRYFQIVRCFRDEDLRADRQPEFTQIDCEMTFVTRDMVLATFEKLLRHIFKVVKNKDLGEIAHMSYDDAMRYYGNDKPDTRFDMRLVELNDVAKGKDFAIFNNAEMVLGICAKGAANYTRKQLDALTDWVKRPQIGAKGMVWVKCNEDGTYNATVKKFYDQDDLKKWADKMGAEPGDLMLILSGDTNKVRKQMSELRLKMGEDLGLRKADEFKALWVLDFPLLEWDEESNFWHACHHPFTRPRPGWEKIENWGDIKAEAYDLVLNGNEIAGGSIRIHERDLQEKMFDLLGMSKEEAETKFGFLMSAFEYGAPPHGGIAFGFDRLCAIMGGQESIRDFIAFPKNNSGRDTMIDAPSPIDDEQYEELAIAPALAETSGQ